MDRQLSLTLGQRSCAPICPHLLKPQQAQERQHNPLCRPTHKPRSVERKRSCTSMPRSKLGPQKDGLSGLTLQRLPIAHLFSLETVLRPMECRSPREEIAIGWERQWDLQSCPRL